MLQRPPRFIRTCAHCLTALACAAAAQAPPVAAQEPAICTVEIRLTQIACAEANDETEKSGARGEYHLRLGTGAEVGPFELRAGEASSFNPGILLDVIDTGILEPADGDELMLPIE
ncbi:MAG: hypothetical protein GWO02_03875, partial [Gammaproteobacteria bacterium]|nr:hypothetical protein [Gammaproteobacteria bacterium]